jgi:hypothetical protein
VSFGMPSLEEDIAVCDSVMRMAPETNGEVAHKSWSALSKKTGIDHHHLYAGRHEDKITFRDIQAQPRKIITAPTWSGIESETCLLHRRLHQHPRAHPVPHADRPRPLLSGSRVVPRLRRRLLLLQAAAGHQGAHKKVPAMC